MKAANLSLYLSDHCNLNCPYCSVDYKIKPSIKEEDVKNFILDNLNEIDTEQIELLGGEPTIIYSKDFLEFLNKYFKRIRVTSNLKDLDGLKQMIEIFRDKVVFSSSFNEEIEETFFYNSEQIIDNINRFSIVVTRENLHKLYENVKRLAKYEKEILLSPEDDKNHTGYSIDKELLEKQLKLIFDDGFYKLLVNFKKIEKNRKSDMKECNEHTLLITKNGELDSCSHASSVYGSVKQFHFGNIFNTKIKDIEVKYPDVDITAYDGTSCLECTKCHNYACSPRIYDSKYGVIQEQICEFHKTFYNFATNYKFFPNITGMTVFMTEQCNMKCTYCFERNFKNQVSNISNEMIKKSLDILFRVDNGSEKKFTFFGGEPSLNIDGIRCAFEYYKELKSKGLKSTLFFDINTNLLVLTDEFIELIKEIREETFFYFSISLDGFKELNDKQRIDLNNKGTYDRVIENVKRLRTEMLCNDTGNMCSMMKMCKHTVLQNENIPFIEQICEEAWSQRYLFDEFSLAYVTADKGEHSHITMENLQFIQDYYWKTLNSEKTPKQKFITQYLEGLNLHPDILNNEGYAICDVIDSVLSVRANGDIIPCHAFLDLIDNSDYSTEVKINNILDINIDDFGFSIKNKWYALLNKDEKLNNGNLIMESELGYECRLCPFKFMCHTCVANLKKIEGNKLIKSKENCMRTLNQAEILLKIKEINAEKELAELSRIENSKIDDILRGIIDVGTLATNNREKIMKLIEIVENKTNE